MGTGGVTLVFLLAALRLNDVARAPGYTGPPISRILVSASAEDARARRTLESDLVARLVDSGVMGFAASRSLSADTPPDDAVLRAFPPSDLARAGGDFALLVVQALRRERLITTGPMARRKAYYHD